MLERWHADFGEDHDAAYAWLAAAYSEPHRAYHKLPHILSVLKALDDALPWVVDPVAMRVAAWVHDAVYEPARRDNEERSAALVPVLFSFVPERLKDKAVRLVMATEKHVPLSDDTDELVFLDLDLLPLAADSGEFAAAERGIRFEYSFLTDEAYRQGRVAVLGNFLGREQIYLHPIHRRYESAARANIQRLIDELRQSGAV